MNRNKLHHPIGDFVCFCSEARAPRSIYQEVPVADFCDSPPNQNIVEIIVKLLGSFPNFFGKFLGAIRLASFPIRPCHCREHHVLVHLPPFLDLTTFIIKQYFPYSDFRCKTANQNVVYQASPPILGQVPHFKHANCQTMGTPQIWQPYQWRPFCSCLGFLQRFRVHKGFDHFHFCTWTLGRL